MNSSERRFEPPWWPVLFWWVILAVLVLCGSAWPQSASGDQAQHAVVRLEILRPGQQLVPGRPPEVAQGGSGTVIATGEGWSYLLSCAHLFADRQGRPSAVLEQARIKVDAPAPASGAPRDVGVRLVGLDHASDLSLIRLPAGPLPYVCPVAPSSHLSARTCLSVGYDQGRQPPQMRRTTLLEQRGDPTRTYTRELPFHGRSGGALIDLENGGVLVGVVSAYTGSHRASPQPEVIAGRQGVYASHQAILAFLAKHGLEPDGVGLRTGQGGYRSIGQRPMPEVQAPAPRYQAEPPDLFAPQLQPRGQRLFPARPAPACPT